METRRYQLIQTAYLRGLLPHNLPNGARSYRRRTAILAQLDREQKAEMRKGLLLPMLPLIVARAGSPDLQSLVTAFQRMWGLAVRLASSDTTASLEWDSEMKMDDAQKKLVELFERLERSGALDDLTDEELAE